MRIKIKRWATSADEVVRTYWRIPEPVVLAGGFAVLATVSSVVAAYFEGRLTAIGHVPLANGTSAAVIPFGENLSTLLDFILLNPIVIFFLQRSRVQRQRIDAKLNLKRIMPLYHRAGLTVLCAVLGVYAMKFYVEGSRFFDATLIPDDRGNATVTATGWIVYTWTALYIAWLLFAAVEHGFHVARLMSLQAKDIPYAPFHPDGAGGIRFLMEPSLNAGYAMIGLLATFVVFIVHDRLLYHIDSNRLIGFALYVVVALPMFALPFCKLHQLMKERRDEYLFVSLDQTLSAVQSAGDRNDWSGLAACVAAIESADKYRKLVCAFPVWPVPIAFALPSLGSIVAAIVPLALKLISHPATAFILPGK